VCLEDFLAGFFCCVLSFTSVFLGNFMLEKKLGLTFFRRTVAFLLPDVGYVGEISFSCKEVFSSTVILVKYVV
jgi:hypothetical protein